MELQDIIDSVNIVDYISQYIDLSEENGEMFGLSPFKTENTPSFSITPETQLFYDFSSGIGGNVLTFIQKYHKCDIYKAIELLKKYANITEEYVDLRLSATKVLKKYKTPENKKPLTQHKILPLNKMSNYENNKSKLQGWVDEGISYEILEKYQVKYDPFDNRIVFPIRDLVGNIISVKGRTLNPDFKEKRIRKYTYFQEIGDIDFIFGYFEHLDIIKEKKEVIVFEGEKSVMLAETWDVCNTGAILTSHLNDFQLLILIKLGVRVVFALDKEIDISTDKNIKKLARFVKVEYIKDTNNYLALKDAPVDKGYITFKELYEGRKSFN